MLKLFLTGASGFLGGNFCVKYASQFDITAVYFNNPIQFPGIKDVKLDLSDFAVLENHTSDINPDLVLHLAASSEPNFCELNPGISYSNNVEATRNLAHICASQKIPLIFASTDLVFDGENAPYSEEDIAKPISIYGKHKVEAEKIVLDSNPKINIVARLPLMYGASFNSGKSFLQPTIEKLKNNQSIHLFTDEYRTIASTDSICEGLRFLIEKQVSGIYHLGGDESLSRYEMGEIFTYIRWLKNAFIF